MMRFAEQAAAFYEVQRSSSCITRQGRCSIWNSREYGVAGLPLRVTAAALSATSDATVRSCRGSGRAG